MKNIQIRPSQFITTYGVGAIVDGPEGSQIILDFANSLLFSNQQPPDDEFIISVPGASRLSKRIAFSNPDLELDEIAIFRLPTNADYSMPDDTPIYATKSFPTWSLCHKSHSGGIQVLYKRNNNVNGKRGICPICANDPAKFDKFSPFQSNLEVMRFVRACPRGHVDDLNWYFEIHGEYFSKRKPGVCPEQEYYEYVDAGSELQFVKIRCPNPKCKKSTTLKEIMNHTPKCTGRVPFKDAPITMTSRIFGKETCTSNSQVIQRTASSIFIPHVITSISLPWEANSFYPLLNFELIYERIVRYYGKHGKPISFNKIRGRFIEWAGLPKIARRHPVIKEHLRILKKINSNPQQKLIAQEIIDYFVLEILGAKTPYDEYTLRLDEFNAFRARNPGLDIDQSLEFKDPVYFSYKDFKFKITPVVQLEAIMLQQGFYRYIKVKKKKSTASGGSPIQESEYEDILLYETPYLASDANYWYLGAKLQGEGIFIELDESYKLNFNDKNKMWKKVQEDLIVLSEIEQLKKGKGEEEKDLDANSRNFLKIFSNFDKKYIDWLKIFKRRGFDIFVNPLGIWWHTLSHRLIKALGLDCGYSSASLRERIYIDLDENIGGILIYASRPGEDGTLGGLVSQADRFDKILKLALDDIDSCSNDPICLTQEFKDYSLNGAICYACGFLSETSCEFGNIGLDRNLLIDSL